jgi:hypothetical protein
LGHCVGNCLSEKQAHETGYTFMKRSRGRNRRSGGNNNSNNHSNPNRHYESVGPDVKIRGSAQQVLEKYQQYARDAHTSGDRVLSEAYFQFAEHYQRIVAKQVEAKDRQQQPRTNRDDRDNRRDDRDTNNNDSNDNDASDNSDQNSDSQESARPARDDESADQQRESSRREPLKVIDADDGADEAATSEKAPGVEDKPAAERPKTRRKPYRAKEATKETAKDAAKETADEPAAVTDGVMKTLSRGRRKAASEAETAQSDDSAA